MISSTDLTLTIKTLAARCAQDVLLNKTRTFFTLKMYC